MATRSLFQLRWLLVGIVMVGIVGMGFSFTHQVEAQTPSDKGSVSPFATTGSGIVQETFRQSGALAPTAGDIDLLLDDGVPEDAIGLTAGGQFVWLNRFTPATTDFPFTLKSIQLYSRNESNCLPTDLVDFYVYLDDDDNPANGAQHIGSLLGQPIGTLEQWNTFPTHILIGEGQDVLIAVVNRTCVASGTFSAAIDMTNSQLRSWAGYYDGGAPMPNPPTIPIPPPYFDLIDTFGFSGNWMVRGTGEFGIDGPTPTPLPTSTPSSTPTITPTPTNTPTPTATSVVPEIHVAPNSFYEEHYEPQVTTDTFSIYNVGSLTLTWAITESASIASSEIVGAEAIAPPRGDCSIPNDISWFSVSPMSGSTGSGDSSVVTITYNTVNPPLPDGQHGGMICIASNDADTPLAPVIVTLYKGPMPTAVEIGSFPSPIAALKPNSIEIGTAGLLLLAGLVVLRRRKR